MYPDLTPPGTCFFLKDKYTHNNGLKSYFLFNPQNALRQQNIRPTTRRICWTQISAVIVSITLYTRSLIIHHTILSCLLKYMIENVPFFLQPRAQFTFSGLLREKNSHIIFQEDSRNGDSNTVPRKGEKGVFYFFF